MIFFRTYGSGYPGLSARAVNGRNFPFGFWPIVWSTAIIAGGENAEYLHRTEVRSFRKLV